MKSGASDPLITKKQEGGGDLSRRVQRDGISLFTQIKTNTKTIGIYRVLGCCVLLKNQNLVSNEMG